MIDLEIFADKLDKDGIRIMRTSYEQARSRSHSRLTPQHVILAIAELEPYLFTSLLQSLNTDPVATMKEAEARVARQKRKEEEMELSNDLRAYL